MSDQNDDQPLGVPPSEFKPHRPEVPFKKRGNVKTALIVGGIIVLLDLLIYFFLIKPDDTQLLKVIEPLKPQTATLAPSIVIPSKSGDIITSQSPIKEALSIITKLAKDDLAKRLKIDQSIIQTESEESVTWNDGSMGCPQPGMMYTQALVDGSKVVLSAKQKPYQYHAGTDGKPFLCETPKQ